MADPPPPPAARFVLVAVAAVLIGSLMLTVSSLMAYQQWQGTRSGTHGTLTLTEPQGCSHYEPPHANTCGWFGDFASDDGQVHQTRMELSGDLPIGTGAVGQTYPGRIGAMFPQFYRDGDVDGWRRNIPFMIGGGVALLIGLLVLEPWWWRQRLRARRSRRLPHA